MNLRAITQKLRPFLLFFTPFWIGGVALVSMLGKKETHLLLNEFHHILTDSFFKYYTHVADGFTVGLVALLLMFTKVKNGLMVALSLALSSLVTGVLKQVFNAPRPIKYFELYPDVKLHVVSGVDLHCCLSFPSGHTTAAFALFGSLAIIFPNKNLQCVFAMAAVLAGYSRVYLSQHHILDTLAGSIIGLAGTILIAALIQPKTIDWLNRPIYRLRS